MKILITGANGQLGSDCVLLLASKHQLLTPNRQKLELGNETGTLSYLAETMPDVVINCAAFTAVDRCETENELAWQANARGPEYLARGCSKYGIRLIHISTDYVFDGALNIPTPYTETDSTNPLSQYGRSKLAGEQAIIAHCADHLILRTAWLYSANGPNFLKTMLYLCLSRPDREFKVVNDQYGSLTWSLTLAQQIEVILKNPELRGVAHATSEGYSSWCEGACYFLEKLGLQHHIIPCTTAEYPTPTHRPANSILENSVLKKMGISVFKSWQEDIDRFTDSFGEQLLSEVQRKS